MPKHVAPINPHVHLRGEEYPQPFFRWGMEDAAAVGICALFEMPNPKPWLTTVPAITARRQFAQSTVGSTAANRHFIHPGLINDTAQIQSMLDQIQHGNLGLVSDKIYYSYSTGGMNFTSEDPQRFAWKYKGQIGYTGVSLAHFEAEDFWKERFDPANPLSHSLRQTEESETVQVERQLRFALDYNFKGTFYVCHCSSPETVRFLMKEKKRPLPFSVVIEATWHHLFLNWSDYSRHGNRVKMNPPLRDNLSQSRLLEHCLAGDIDVIGDDHAPHPLPSKDDPLKPVSGVPALPFWPRGIELLRKYRITEPLLERIIFSNANRIFKLNLPATEVVVSYNPELWVKYGYNPFSRLSA